MPLLTDARTAGHGTDQAWQQADAFPEAHCITICPMKSMIVVAVGPVDKRKTADLLHFAPRWRGAWVLAPLDTGRRQGAFVRLHC